jgi:hypothetical protein
VAASVVQCREACETDCPPFSSPLLRCQVILIYMCGLNRSPEAVAWNILITVLNANAFR